EISAGQQPTAPGDWGSWSKWPPVVAQVDEKSQGERCPGRDRLGGCGSALPGGGTNHPKFPHPQAGHTHAWECIKKPIPRNLARAIAITPLKMGTGEPPFVWHGHSCPCGKTARTGMSVPHERWLPGFLFSGSVAK